MTRKTVECDPQACDSQRHLSSESSIGSYVGQPGSRLACRFLVLQMMAETIATFVSIWWASRTVKWDSIYFAMIVVPVMNAVIVACGIASLLSRWNKESRATVILSMVAMLAIGVISWFTVFAYLLYREQW